MLKCTPSAGETNLATIQRSNRIDHVKRDGGVIEAATGGARQGLSKHLGQMLISPTCP